MRVSGNMIALTDTQQNAVLGTYHMQSGDIMCVTCGPKFLMASIKGKFSAGLLPLSPTIFYMPLSSGTAMFTISPNGKASAVNLRYDGVDHPGSLVAQNNAGCT